MNKQFSLFKTINEKVKTVDISTAQYIEAVKNGRYQDKVLKARVAALTDKEQYKKIKNTLPVITGSAIMRGEGKQAANIEQLNGLIVLDIDEQVNTQLLAKIQNDKYSHIVHRSVSGNGVCVFVKINENKFAESFFELGQYYFDNFDLTIDGSCKNPNRLRFLSYDPHLYENAESKKFVAKSLPKKKQAKPISYIYAKNDFEEIINKITSQRIDLCNDDYERYCKIGFAIGGHFGASGLDYFKTVCQFGSKYDADKIEKHYKNFCRDGGIKLSTFYFYVKEAGIEIYSETTSKTITTVQAQKAQGTATVESVTKQLKTLKFDNPDEELIQKLIDSKEDYSKSINTEGGDVEQLRAFITDNFSPYRDGITEEIFVDEQVITDQKLNSIYFAAKACLQNGVTKSDVRDMINSESTPTISPLGEFFTNKKYTPGTIDKYINCIEPQSDYNRWAFKKWVVGTVHNWLSSTHDSRACPLTLVLCAQDQGTGKTSFFRKLLPLELKRYMIEHKIDGKDKDSMYNLAKGLIILDDEFGGLATKDVKDFKKIADTAMIDIRLPYSAYYQKMKRKASLCGTSNDYSILKDVTGNRRILPINVKSINFDAMDDVDKGDLWREALALYRSGFDWAIYTKEDKKILDDATSENVEAMPIEELFFQLYSLEKTETHSQRMVKNKGEILNEMNIHYAVKPTKYDIGDIVIKNKLSYTAHREGDFLKKGMILYVKPVTFN